MRNNEIQRVSIKRRKKRNGGGCLSYMLVICFSAVLAIVVAFNLYLASLKPISNFDEIQPNPVTTIYSADGENIKTFTAYTFSKVELADVPEQLKEAIIATEDKNFYRHHGYDIFGLFRSSIQNVLARRVVQGASTITQQLARILFLSNERTMTRKIKELVIAARIEKTISKDKILELYLNTIYFGSDFYGIRQASRGYFGKEPKELELPESTMLAGLPNAPSLYSPYVDFMLAKKRQFIVIDAMQNNGYISKDIAESAKIQPLYLAQEK